MILYWHILSRTYCKPILITILVEDDARPTIRTQ